jgi:hypothetical protein
VSKVDFIMTKTQESFLAAQSIEVAKAIKYKNGNLNPGVFHPVLVGNEWQLEAGVGFPLLDKTSFKQKIIVEKNFKVDGEESTKFYRLTSTVWWNSDLPNKKDSVTITQLVKE